MRLEAADGEAGREGILSRIQPSVEVDEDDQTRRPDRTRPDRASVAEQIQWPAKAVVRRAGARANFVLEGEPRNRKRDKEGKNPASKRKALKDGRGVGWGGVEGGREKKKRRRME